MVARREFLVLAAGAAGAGLLAGCAVLAVTPVAPDAGFVRLSRLQHPRLDEPGGSVRLDVAGVGLVFVLALDDGTWAALSPVCTHLGCTVNVEGGLLVCPCHGSTYERTGRVIQGPAERPLARYPVQVEGDVLVIDVREVAA